MNLLKLITLSFLIVTSSKGFTQEDNILTVEDDKVSLEEFESIYNKNNTQVKAIDPKTVEEYMELFINFKLKVKAAEDLGLDTVQEFIKELAGYRKQLVQPYLTDNEVTDELIKEAYDRMQTDIRASHILVKLPSDPLPEDTLKAFKKINALRSKIKSREDFEKVAMENSEDPSVKNNKGDLGYFTAFNMVYPFEDRAYKTEVGTISKPCRSRFGYHIIWVDDKRPARGEMKAAHIMIRSKSNKEDLREDEAKIKIDEIYKKLKEGEEFSLLAAQYSDDKGSGAKGGELPWFGTGKMDPIFENECFKLENNGDYSEPFKTSYGWHIAKRIDVKKPKTFDEVESELKRKVQRDGRSRKSKSSFISKIKDEYGYNPNLKYVYAFDGKLGDKFKNKEWNAADFANMKALIFTLEDKSNNVIKQYSQADFATFIENDRRIRRQKFGSEKDLISALFNQFSNQAILQFEEDNLENKYPEFKALMKEYRDGILLFELMDQKVWSKAVKDTAGMEVFYTSHKNDFMWEERAEVKVYSCANEEIAKATRKLIKKQSKKGWEDEYILEKINENSKLNLQIESGKYQKGENILLSNFSWKVGVSDNLTIDERVVFVNVISINPPQPKQISEARGLITSAYQNYLEKQWIDELRSTYNYKVNKELLKQVE